MSETGRFFRGAWKPDERKDNQFNVLTVLPSPRYSSEPGSEQMPFSPVVALDGIPLKCVQKVNIEMSINDWTRVTIELVPNVVLELPLIEIPGDGDQE